MIWALLVPAAISHAPPWRGLSGRPSDSAVAPGTRGSGDDPWLLTFSLELPLWIPSYRAGQREADARWHAARRNRSNSENRLVADVKLALYRRREAARQLSLYSNTLIPKAEESLAATEAAFQTGSADYLDMIEAERTLLELRLSAERAAANRLLAEATIDRLLGRFGPIPSGPSEDTETLP